MRYLFVLLTIVFSSFTAMSQTYSKDLEKSYSKKELQAMSNEDIKVLNYALENGIYITDLPTKELISINNINISQGITKFTDASLRIENQNQYYRIIGTDKMLVVKSKYVLQNELLNNKN